MSAVLDVIVVLIIGLTVLICGKRGFFKTLMGFGSFVIATIVVSLFLSPLAETFAESEMADSIRQNVNNRIAETVSSTAEEYNPADAVESSGFASLLKAVGIDEDEFRNKWNGWLEEKTDKLKSDLVDFIAEPIIKALSNLLAFVILFFGTSIVVKIAFFIVDKICVLPILKQANTILGVLVGIVVAYFIVSAFCVIVEWGLPILQANDIAFINKIDPDGTIVFSFFERIGILGLLFG